MPLGKTIAFLGAGNMAEALVKGLLRAGVATPGEILLTDRRKDRLAELEKRFGVKTSTDNLAAVRQAGIVVLSVKPQVMNKVLAEVAPAIDASKLVISIAAGVPLAAIERKVGHGVRIVRTMPNTSVLCSMSSTWPPVPSRLMAAVAGCHQPRMLKLPGRSLNCWLQG